MLDYIAVVKKVKNEDNKVTKYQGFIDKGNENDNSISRRYNGSQHEW